MNLTVSRADFARLLSDVSKAIEKRTTIPILSNIRLSSDASGGLVVTGTDLDIEITKRISASVTQPGETTVSASRLHAVVAKIGASELSLALDNNTLVVKAGRSRFTLPTLPVEDFPSSNVDEEFIEFDVDINSLINPVRFSISTEETRYYLNGIYVHLFEGNLRAVSTDGHKLSLHDVTKPAEANEFAGVIIPRKTVELLRIFKDHVHIKISTTKVIFSTEDTQIVSKLIDGSFPDYMRVIPKNNDKHATVDRAEFAAAVERTSTVASDRGKAIKVTLANGSIQLSVDSDEGTSRDEIETDYSGDQIEFGLNANYLLELLASESGTQVEMAVADPGSPVLFTNPSDASWLGIIMPVRV